MIRCRLCDAPVKVDYIRPWRFVIWHSHPAQLDPTECLYRESPVRDAEDAEKDQWRCIYEDGIYEQIHIDVII